MRCNRPQRPRNGCVSIAMLEALQRAEFARVEALLQNDFHEIIAARSPEVARAVEALRAAGAGNALLAGSGSCVFTVAPERSTIEAIARSLELPPDVRTLRDAVCVDAGVEMNAVVLAGGPLDDVARLQPGAPNKAFVDICGTTLVGRVLAALRGCAAISRIVVVTPESEWRNPQLRDADDFRLDGVHISESLRNGIADFPKADSLLSWHRTCRCSPRRSPAILWRAWRQPMPT